MKKKLKIQLISHLCFALIIILFYSNWSLSLSSFKNSALFGLFLVGGICWAILNQILLNKK